MNTIFGVFRLLLLLLPITHVWTQYEQTAVLYTLQTYTLYKGPPPLNDRDIWLNRAHTIVDRSNLADSIFMFFDHFGHLTWVTKGGLLYRNYYPSHWNDNRNIFPLLMGRSGWEHFKFLFCNPADGKLYAVTYNGLFYRATPPSDDNDNWIGRAENIGHGNWHQFLFLTVNPAGELFGVTLKGLMYRGSPPVSPDDYWLGRARRVGGLEDQWSLRCKAIMFDPNGLLYVVTRTGELYKSWPPMTSTRSWFSDARQVGSFNWNIYNYYFFNTMKETLPVSEVPRIS